jgi:hypothetical protein
MQQLLDLASQRAVQHFVCSGLEVQGTGGKATGKTVRRAAQQLICREQSNVRVRELS